MTIICCQLHYRPADIPQSSLRTMAKDVRRAMLPAKTLMTHSLNKEASQLLCDAMRCRLEDGDDSGEPWTDFAGSELTPDRFWNSSMDEMISADNEGPCMGIELNIWERAKVGILYIIKSLKPIMLIMTINFMFIFFGV